MRKRRLDFSDVHLYVVTQAQTGRDYVDFVRKVCTGGADMVQLRDKDLSAKELFQLAKELQSICDKTGALFILNDRVDVAKAADVDGVHLGQQDLPAREARQILGHTKIIGVSTHSTAQALQAAGDGADYIACGPVFRTPTKPDYLPVGLELVKEYKRLVRIPFVAIGGVEEANVERVIAAGADRVAVVRAVGAAADPASAARSLKAKIIVSLARRAETALGGIA